MRRFKEGPMCVFARSGFHVEWWAKHHAMLVLFWYQRPVADVVRFTVYVLDRTGMVHVTLSARYISTSQRNTKAV